MHIWWTAATQNGISADTLPFILLVLVLTWLGTYFSSWRSSAGGTLARLVPAARR